MSQREPELRAALAAEPDPEVRESRLTDGGDSETRERLELRNKSKFGRFIFAAISARAVDGVEAEYAAAEGVSAAGQIPIDLFETRRVETRAVTPSPATAPMQIQAPTVPYVFARSMAARLGVQFPIVQAGQANVPVLETPPPAGAVAKDAAALVTAGAFRLDTRTPQRIASQFELRVEDLAVFPTMEDDLIRAAMGAIANALDAQVISGDNVGANLNGLFKQATDAAAKTAVVSYPSGLALFAALVDGRFANSLRDLYAVIGSATFAKFAGLFQTASATTLWDYLESQLGFFGVSNRVPAVSATAQKALVIRAGEGVDPIRVHTWSAMEVVVDPYSGAGAGKRTLTFTALVGDPHVPETTNQVIEIHPKLS